MANYYVYADEIAAQAVADDMSAKYVPLVRETDVSGNPTNQPQITQRWDIPQMRNDEKWIVQENPLYNIPPEHTPLSIEPYDKHWFDQIILSLSPENNAVDVDATTNLVATFYNHVAFGTGNFHVYDSADQLVASLTVFGQVGTGGIISAEGKELTVDLTDKFKAGSRYYVLMDDTLIDGFPGIADKTVWTWTVALATRSGRARLHKDVPKTKAKKR